MQARLLVSLLAAHASAATLTCSDIRVDDQTFDLEKLGGPHSVVTTLREPPSHSNTTYTVDVCSPLKPKGDVPAEERCPDGTRGVFPFIAFLTPAVSARLWGGGAGMWRC